MAESNLVHTMKLLMSSLWSDKRLFVPKDMLLITQRFGIFTWSAVRYNLVLTIDLSSSRIQRMLRSVGTNRLVVPNSRLSTVGSWALPVAGPQTWNDLPEDVASAESLTTFRLLKTHLFRKSFPDYLLDISWLCPVDLAVGVLLLRPPKNWLND